MNSMEHGHESCWYNKCDKLAYIFSYDELHNLLGSLGQCLGRQPAVNMLLSDLSYVAKEVWVCLCLMRTCQTVG